MKNNEKLKNINNEKKANEIIINLFIKKYDNSKFKEKQTIRRGN